MIVSSPLPKHVHQRARVASSSMCLCDKAEPDVTDSLVHLVHKLCQSLVDQLVIAFDQAVRAEPFAGAEQQHALLHLWLEHALDLGRLARAAPESGKVHLLDQQTRRAQAGELLGGEEVAGARLLNRRCLLQDGLLGLVELVALRLFDARRAQAQLRFVCVVELHSALNLVLKRRSSLVLHGAEDLAQRSGHEVVDARGARPRLASLARRMQRLLEARWRSPRVALLAMALLVGGDWQREHRLLIQLSSLDAR
mmetsp:Transcript_23758/g.51949  ORF Transcript_23758/g.51949 Transcript_23758/m.51949 type:complete len:253 (+) Transcript_23758:447-1205(+)